MREVADRAGVAMSSVSRVLSGHPDVSPRMRQVVMTAVRELGYRPDMLAQGLRRGKTFSVGFTVSDIANPVLAEIVTGAEKRLREAGYSLLLTNSEGDPDLDVEHISLLERRRVDGLILSLAEENHPATVAALRQLTVPVVLVDRDVPPGAKARCVAFDHAAGMKAAADRLLALGHREFALITGGPERPSRERRRAAEEAIAAAANGARCTVYEGDFSIENGRRATGQILASSPRPTAIIAGGNLLMQGALLALHAARVEVGREVSFVGCDDLAIAEVHQPPIAVVRRDVPAAGIAAAELLLGELENDGGPQRVVLPTEFVARASCAPVPWGRNRFRYRPHG
ncbi:MAG: LacI family transcriptional regulator [Candidatus Rokuibacteriota bacterium]|nr:MAG: LacI family transcriptional regulator [Candidatus Rokubacteria bacterium]